MSLIITDMSSDVKQKLSSSSSTNASILTHTDFKVKSHGAGAYCGGHLAAQLVSPCGSIQILKQLNILSGISRYIS